MKTIQGYKEGTTSVKEVFQLWIQASCQISKDLHTFDYRDGFVSVKVDILTKT